MDERCSLGLYTADGSVVACDSTRTPTFRARYMIFLLQCVSFDLSEEWRRPHQPVYAATTSKIDAVLRLAVDDVSV
jgi:hypothetical protein